MNSVDRHLTVASKAATLLAMRSARREVLLVVEGDEDIDFIANGFGVARSNMLSCGGKEILMSLFSLAPQKGIDEGSIFIRDRDFDDIETHEKCGTLIAVTNLHDIEMELLRNRLFHRIALDYTKGHLNDDQLYDLFKNICNLSGLIGALRLYASHHDIPLKFDNLKYNRFFDVKSMSIDIDCMIKYIFSKSSILCTDVSEVSKFILNSLEERGSEDVSCSKELIDIFHLAIMRNCNLPAAECSSNVLSRTMRVCIVFEDVKNLSYYSKLKDKVGSVQFKWVGVEFD